MIDRSMGPEATLPRSHYFISVARGAHMRTVRVRTDLLRGALAGAAVLGLWLIGSTAYLAFHDDLLASLMAREARMQYAYEDRIAALRTQVDREASLKLVNQSTIEGELRDLSQRASALEIRSGLVGDLAGRMGLARQAAAGIVPSAGHAAAAEAGSPGDATEVPAARKPRPEAALEAPLPTAPGEPPLRVKIAAVAEALEHADAAQYAGLAAVGERARERVEAVRAALQQAGVSQDRLVPRAEEGGQGGPFVPLDAAITGSPFGRALEKLQGDIVAASALTQALPRLPFAKPMPGELDVTSPFGARLDPFLGRPALHTGVDLREAYGSDVEATAAGRVVSAGPAGGYGVMVEIDHGHGLSTRYAHLAAVTVEPGQQVARGDVIGQVGATGRATGPHLHYETRLDGEPVDPMRFLEAGEKLAALDMLR